MTRLPTLRHVTELDPPPDVLPHGHRVSPSIAGESGLHTGKHLVTPTVFRHGPFRYYFFSREERRPHVHVQSGDGEAKFWIEPDVELAGSHGLATHELRRIREIIDERRGEIEDAWDDHFGR